MEFTDRGSEVLVLQQLRRAGALVLGALQAMADEVVATAGDAGGDRRDLREGSDVVQGIHHVVECPIAPRLLRRDHLDHGAAETPDVGLAAVASLLADDLRRHPWHRAERRERLRVVATFGATEIGQLDAKFEVHQHVGTLDIPVNDGRRPSVQVVQTLQHAERRLPERRTREWSEFAEDGRDRAAGHILEVDEEVLVCVVVAQVADNVWVAKGLTDLKLAGEPIPILAIVALVEQGLLHCENLQRSRVEGFEDSAEGAGPNCLPTSPTEPLSTNWRGAP
mmetsp:Transcript_50482/g.127237  ORF Transcript_50482/g.127237 Transcript_50482/m.127237 type:complete len:280 (-) Transcript_50482:512-1351(-)